MYARLATFGVARRAEGGHKGGIQILQKKRSVAALYTSMSIYIFIYFYI